MCWKGARLDSASVRFLRVMMCEIYLIIFLKKLMQESKMEKNWKGSNHLCVINKLMFEGDESWEEMKMGTSLCCIFALVAKSNSFTNYEESQACF